MMDNIIKDALHNIDLFTQRMEQRFDNFEVYVDYVDPRSFKVIQEYRPLNDFAQIVNKETNYFIKARLLTSFYSEAMEKIDDQKHDSEKLRIQMMQLENVLKEHIKNDKESSKQKGSKDPKPKPNEQQEVDETLPENFILPEPQIATDEVESLEKGG